MAIRFLGRDGTFSMEQPENYRNQKFRDTEFWG